MVDAATGEITQIVRADPDGIVRNAVWSPDGKMIYYERRLPTGAGGVVARDLSGGDERVVQSGNVGTLALSPDGTLLAFTTDSFAGHLTHVLRVVPTAGGEAREIFRSKESEPFHSATPLAWMPDGRHLIIGTGPFSGAPGSGDALELWRIPVEGGKAVSLGPAMSQLTHLRVHPDGKRVVFEAGERRAEVWALDNILPELQAKR